MADSNIGSSQSRWSQWLALGGLTICVLSGMLVPIYTDEIAWRFQERAAIDGGLDIMINDVCGPSSYARPPWFMMPVRQFSAITNQALADPIFIRGAGVACALAWISLFWVLVGKLEADKVQRVRLRTLTLSLLGLGVLPYILVISRPEQPLILATVLILLLTFTNRATARPAVLAWLKAAGIVVLTIVMLSYHLKGVLYAGVGAVCLLVSIRGRGTLAPRVAGAALIGALILISAKYWTGRFNCPGDPVLAHALNKENVASLWANGGRLSTVVWKMVGDANVLDYVGLAAPKTDPMSHWLLPKLFPASVAFAIQAGMFALWGGALLLAVAVLCRFIYANGWRARAEPRTLVAVGLLAVVLIWAASQLIKNVYEAEHVLPSLALLAVLGLTLPGTGSATRPYVRWLAAVALPAALCSEVIVLGMTLPLMTLSARYPGYAWRQPFSITAFGYSAIRRDIAEARSASGMPTGRRLERPMVDDLTYMALQDSHLPFHRMGVVSVWKGSITDPARYLLSRQSDGAIVGCDVLPPAMLAAASRSGKICAISHDGLARLAARSVTPK